MYYSQASFDVGMNESPAGNNTDFSFMQTSALSVGVVIGITKTTGT